MDLLRRRGAGELAELLGANLIAHDRRIRRHGFRAGCRRALEALPPQHRAVVTAYAEGVNAGLAQLGARPPEYLLLMTPPTAWRTEDSLLVGMAMFLDLQDSQGDEDLRREIVARALPPAAAAFYFPAASDWDAALDGSILPTVPLPGPEVLDFARDERHPTLPGPQRGAEPPADGPPPVPGSNAWGVEGAATATGAAIVCDDMHLGLRLPNIWFRACLYYTDAAGAERRVVGATLPGIPNVIVGSNGDLAWGFTNASLDNSDLVVVEVDPHDPSRYRTPQGWQAFEEVTEIIRVRGAAAVTNQYPRTIWGPVVGQAGEHRMHALLWTPERPGGVNLNLLELETTRTVEAALALAPLCGTPVQNLLVGDRSGALAYTLIGRLPRRRGFDGTRPVSLAADPQAGWYGWVTPEATPRWIAPAGGRLWTANNRILGAPGYLAMGALDTDLGARALQIRDDLLALRAPVSETDLLTIHRDDRALFLARWQTLLLGVLDGPSPGTNTADWAEARVHVLNWGARASPESVGYRLVRSFRHLAIQNLVQPAVAKCEAAKGDASVGFHIARQEAPAWSLLENRPPHLLPPRFPSYEALLADAAQAVLLDLARQQVPVREATWGARNTLRIQHPLSQAVPELGRWLDLPPWAMAGDDHMPRVQGVDFGPSERMVVSPGQEERGVMHMPGGQSGHFLSPFYRRGHEAWLQVEASPLLPGPSRYTLLLRPGGD